MEGKARQRQRRAAGRRSRSRTLRRQGRYVSSQRAERVTDLAFDATVRAAAPYQLQRRQQPAAAAHRTPHLIVYRDDLRQKVRVRRTRNAVCFVVDASWSMAAEERMHATKTAVLSLLRDAYQRRDRVGLVSFQRTYASILLPLTNSVDLARRCLHTMPTGGKTPLARGMLTGFEVLYRAHYRDPDVIPLLVLITDGQANVAMGQTAPQQEAYEVASLIARQQMRAVVIDTEHPQFDRGLTRTIASKLQGEYYRLGDLSNDGLARMVRAQMQQ
jgi:magnesium chelatase subunit D